MTDDGSIQLPSLTIPYSSLASREAQRNFLELARFFAPPLNQNEKPDMAKLDIKEVRKDLDDCVMRPNVDLLRETFPVQIEEQRIGGVRVHTIDPVKGVAPKNRRRVLINLHGGGFVVGAGLGGQMESIPIASIGEIKVITIDYRQWPEHKFPAASEDVAAVYRELLKRNYSARSIGIYGCSAGGMLAAQANVWFQNHGLPTPGAIGMFGAGALVPSKGDSRYIGALLNGQRSITSDTVESTSPYFSVPGLNVNDPQVSPAYSPSAMAGFPPSLLISGTRDVGLSSVVFTHARLIQQHIDAHLHVWEGASHCSFAQPIVDPDVPETRETWSVIVNFFDRYLSH